MVVHHDHIKDKCQVDQGQGPFGKLCYTLTLSFCKILMQYFSSRFTFQEIGHKHWKFGFLGIKTLWTSAKE